jgi:NDP-sugar pyrophosphorylase family protein
LAERVDIYEELLRSSPEMAPAGTRAVILAGGRGTRLAPYTSILPKPLMPIGDRAILELVVDRLAACGITQITLSVGHLAHLIRAVFDGFADHGVTFEYVHEAKELGTAGPLTLVDDLDQTFLVMNGDVLTTLNYAELLDVHRAEGNAMTIAAHRRSIKIDYGVLNVESDDVSSTVVSFDEKPELSALVSMGVYALEPSVLELIPPDSRFDVPDLVRELLHRGMKVGTLRHHGMWFDIGRHEDYEAAVTAWLSSSSGIGTTTHEALKATPLQQLPNGDQPL